jgi:hypothetical protein
VAPIIHARKQRVNGRRGRRWRGPNVGAPPANADPGPGPEPASAPAERPLDRGHITAGRRHRRRERHGIVEDHLVTPRALLAGAQQTGLA